MRRLPAMYGAEALVLVDPQKVPERFVSSTVVEDVQDRLALIGEDVLSNTRLKKTIEDLNLYAKERKTMTTEEVVGIMRTRDLEIRFEKGLNGSRTGAFRIIFQGPDPVTVAEVANRFAGLFIQQNQLSRETQAEGTSEFIDTQLQDAKRALDEQEAAVSAYKLRFNGELPQQETSLIAMMTNLQMKLQGNQDALNRAQQNKVMLETALSSATALDESAERSAAMHRAAEAAPSSEREQPAAPPERRSKRIKAELEAARLHYTDDHPDVRRLADVLEVTQREEAGEEAREEAREEAMVARLVKPAKPANTNGANMPPAPNEESILRRRERTQAHERVEAVRSQLTLTSEEIRTRSQEREIVVAQMTAYQRRIEQLPVREQEMARVTRDYEFSKANYRSLLDKKMAAGMSTDLEKRDKAERFRILDRAHVPQKPAKPNRPALYGVAAIAGVLLGLLAAIGKEYSAGVMLGEWELPADLVVLSRVPFIESRGAADAA